MHRKKPVYVGEHDPYARYIGERPSMLGDELHKVLKWAQFFKHRKCGCCSRRRELNRWPIERCESSVPQIVDMLRQGAEELGLPFSAWLAEKLVRRAIRRVKNASA